jgi:hypothetical protein
LPGERKNQSPGDLDASDDPTSNQGESTMYARMVSGSVPIEKIDMAIRLWQESVLPSARKQRGFKGVRFLVDRAAGIIVTMGLWESEADFKATVDWNQGQIDKFAGMFFTPPEVGGYEVVVDV